jgi:UMF1 family MFS transporter
MFGYRLFNFAAFNLTMVMMPEWYGIDGSLPARISFLSVGIWWIGLHSYFYHLPNNIFSKEPERLYLQRT